MYVQLAPMHHHAIERVIVTMREQTEPLSLEDMADQAALSPFHFCRVFRSVVGIPPGEFQAALRLERAKQLLLTTALSVTDICFEVGYTSLGTFTTRFTRLVGLPPHQLRRLAADFTPPSLRLIEARPQLEVVPGMTGITLPGVSGRIVAPPDFAGLIFAGLFPKPVPQGFPIGCTRLTAPGPYHIAYVPDGRYYLLVAALSDAENPFAPLLSHPNMLVGSSQRPVFVRGGVASRPVHIRLHQPALTDPPVLISLLLLLNRNAPAQALATS